MILYRAEDETATIEANLDCKNNFYELRSQSQEIYDDYLREKAMTEKMCKDMIIKFE